MEARIRSSIPAIILTALVSVLMLPALLVLSPAPSTAQPTGTVRGTVKVAKAPSPLPPLKVVTQQEVCGHSAPNDGLVVGPGGALANVVVWLQGVPGASAAASGVTVTLDQRRCRFLPHVQTATVGSTLGLTSRDPVLHNIHAYIDGRTIFNVAIPVAGMVVRRPVGEPGRIEIKCDVHNWMSAWVYGFEHSYHATTGEDGAFRIERVPPGTYPVRAWHERLGERTGSVTVTGSGSAEVNLSY